jgi:hypothetical protein
MSKSKPKKTSGTSKRKIHFEESGSNFPTDIDESVLHDEISDYGDNFAERDVCSI